MKDYNDTPDSVQAGQSLTRRGFLSGMVQLVGGVGLSTVPLFTTPSQTDSLWIAPQKSIFNITPPVCDHSVNPSAVKAVSKQVSEMMMSFYNRHTGESLKKCAFWVEGKFVPEALKDINKLFRDHRTNTIHAIDRDLLTLLHQIRQKLGTTEPFHLISGYRSPKSNCMLASNSQGVAKKSLHLVGKAADIYVPGRSLKHVQGAAKALSRGGVGRYTQFVHVDTGRVRYWGL